MKIKKSNMADTAVLIII